MQAALRTVFTQWGLPAAIRVDNGWPWGSASDLPPPFALWLCGLGIAVLPNHPHRPQENGIVERFHGLFTPWAEPSACPDFPTWDARLAWLTRLQRERYPACQGHSRLAAWPTLACVARPYTPAAEAGLWDVDRVTAYLAQGLWRRQVDKVGRITLYHRPYSVGRPSAGQRVFVRFDPTPPTWVIQAASGRELRRHPAAEITAERICALEVSHVKPSQRRPPATQLADSTAT